MGISHSPSTLACVTSGIWTDEVIEVDAGYGGVRRQHDVEDVATDLGRGPIRLRGRLERLGLRDGVDDVHVGLFEGDPCQDALIELAAREL